MKSILQSAEEETIDIYPRLEMPGWNSKLFNVILLVELYFLLCYRISSSSTQELEKDNFKFSF